MQPSSPDPETTPETEPPVLTNRQRHALRGLGHHLQPVVLVGKEGFSPSLLQSVEAALTAHELIKLKLGQNCPLEKNEAAGLLQQHTGGFLVQVIGRTLLLYRPNPKLPPGKRITL
ncbi:MAG: ribosome assembly RNA-binding protein YhbY [Desulfobulbus sp.]|jgi:RNA-binding protein